MTRQFARLGAIAAVAAALLAGSGAQAGIRPTVELEKDTCAGPVALVMAGPDGSAVFHGLDAGRYVITMPAEVGALSLAVAEGDTGRWIPGRLSAAADGRRYAIGADGQRIVVSVSQSGGEVRIQLRGI